MGSETDLLSAVLMALQLEPGIVAWRNNSGRKGRVRFGLGNGSADIVGIVAPAGRFFALELKVGKGKQSPAQHGWEGQVKAKGGIYAVVRSVILDPAQVQHWETRQEAQRWLKARVAWQKSRGLKGCKGPAVIPVGMDRRAA